MKLLSYTLLLICLLGAPSIATAAEGYEGYVYEAVGARSGKGLNDFNATIGGGAEMAITKELGVAGDLGYSFLNRKDDFAIFSPGIFYRFQPKRKVVPFLDGGYAVAFRDNSINLVYFGGGVNYWANKDFGLKVAVRNNTSADDPAKFNLIQFKIGLIFR